MTCHNCQLKAKKHGKDRYGNQRYRCLTCIKTFIEAQEKPLEGMYLPLEKATQVLSMLLEGMSIRSVQRLTGVEKHTILKLLILAGEKCERLLEEKIKAVPVRHVQCDEVWTFIQMKRRTKIDRELVDREIGDSWTFIALEETTKLILTHHVGHRTLTDAVQFTEKLDQATRGSFQISTDGWQGYPDAINYSLGTRVSHAMLIKIYENKAETKMTSKRYSPTRFMKAIKHEGFGQPDMSKLCTSHVERFNLSLRMSVRRFTRLTNAFSRKYSNLRAMIAIFIAYYNFCRSHKSLKGCTPAMAHGIEKTFWTVEDLLKY